MFEISKIRMDESLHILGLTERNPHMGKIFVGEFCVKFYRLMIINENTFTLNHNSSVCVLIILKSIGKNKFKIHGKLKNGPILTKKIGKHL